MRRQHHARSKHKENCWSCDAFVRINIRGGRFVNWTLGAADLVWKALLIRETRLSHGARQDNYFSKL